VIKAMKEVADIIADHTGLSRKVLEYSQLMKRLVDHAKTPGFSVRSWDPLKELIAVDEFVRIGNFREVMDWQGYIDFLTHWAVASEWECSFRRITESGSTVFLELEERSRIGDFRSVVNSVSVYEFNDAGKIVHMDIYLQKEWPDSGMLSSYQDAGIPE
jgi:hypothetical protein